MPALKISPLKDSINFIVFRAEVEDIQHNLQLQLANKRDDKLYAVRYFDFRIREIQGAITHLDLLVAKRQRQAEERRKSKDPLVQFQNSLDALAEAQGRQLNKLARQLSAQGEPIYRSGDEIFAEQVHDEKTKLKGMLLRYQVARQGFELSPEEQRVLYTTIDELYREQVNNRSWYQHGLFVVLISILLLPLAPLFRYLWKAEREKEMIQPSIKSILKPEEREQIKLKRRMFKETANQYGVHFHEKETKTSLASDSIPRYATKQQNARYQFFSTIQFASEPTIDWVKQSKNEDREYRLLVGLK
ncbi:hypothetical protein EAS68_10700 [Legionella jordanis]|uniref:hypothetical protein n=1 Tax=Legionella jordanis TaxID=456 RepID=UPI000F00A15E|nr:hypothetical protein [Legionella jordanis]RMX17355.1 hypothetical protein EAS68_10700 [Legionella jordanis]